MTSTKLDLSFKKKPQMKLLLLCTISNQCFIPSKVGVEGELMSKKASLPQFSNKDQPFTFGLLLGLIQSAIFTWFEGTGDLNTKGFSSGMSDGLVRKSKLNM